MNTPTLPDRAKFESWAVKYAAAEFGILALGRDGDTYAFSFARMLWDAWRAALSSALPQPDSGHQAQRHAIESAWRAGYYDAGYTHDSAYADKQAGDYADIAFGHQAERSADTPEPSGEQS